MRLVNWNVQRRGPDAPRPGLALERIAAQSPDVVCLTEAHPQLLGPMGGHLLTDRGMSWGGEAADQCKVLLWSRNPWRETKTWPDLSALGGAVSGVTETDLGEIRVVGVCTPHHFASPNGALPRPPLWSMHLDFLDALKVALDGLDRSSPLVVTGAFNQFLPLLWGTWKAHHRLKSALRGLRVATEGEIPPGEELTMDHVATSKQLRASDLRAIDRFDADSRPLSDHFGVLVELALSGVTIFD